MFRLISLMVVGVASTWGLETASAQASKLSSVAAFQDKGCQEKIVAYALERQRSSLDLGADFDSSRVESDLFYDFAFVNLWYSSAEEDYSYQEVHQIGVERGSCDISLHKVIEENEW